MNTQIIKVLLVEDSPSDARLTQHDLSQAAGQIFEVAVADRLSNAIEKLREQEFDVALVDLGLPDSMGSATFTRIQEEFPQLPIVILTGLEEEVAGAEAIRLGVQDYLVKGTTDSRFMGRAIRYAIERKRTEETLRRTAEDLARSNKDLERFAYVASHDLQEPLRTIRGYLQIIAKRYNDKIDQDATDFIHFAVDGAARMQNLILDLLAYSRVGSQGKPLMPVLAEEALEDALRSLNETIADTDALVTHGPFPIVQGDKGQLTQLFLNLIGNAIKFRRENVRPEVHLSAERKGSEYLFRVADNGIGIDSKYCEKIFVIFQRLHSMEKYKGTGIGLAICKRIVERHGGHIWVESEVDRGASFFFTLPKP